MSDKYDFGGLFFVIAAPLLFSGIVGLYAGFIPLSAFIALLVALYLLLCSSNAMSNSYNKRRHQAKGGRRR